MNLPIITFKSVGREIGLDVRVVDGRLQIKELLPRPLWAQRLSSKSSFCRAVVQSGLLTHRQMVHAALRYRLGRSKDDAVIYWQIDQLGQVHDGKLMWYGPDCHRLKHRNATWVMSRLKRHYGIPQDAFHSTHVFFGTHLLSIKGQVCGPKEGRSFHSKNIPHEEERRARTFLEERGLTSIPRTVAIVEAEKSAVILSELYPQYIWLATGGLEEVQVNKFMPLSYYKVILFPDTDPDGRAFTRWHEAAQAVMKSFFWPRNNPIRVSPFLERRASEDQKRRKIDLVDYIIESRLQTHAN